MHKLQSYKFIFIFLFSLFALFVCLFVVVLILQPNMQNNSLLTWVTGVLTQFTWLTWHSTNSHLISKISRSHRSLLAPREGEMDDSFNLPVDVLVLWCGICRDRTTSRTLQSVAHFKDLFSCQGSFYFLSKSSEKLSLLAILQLPSFLLIVNKSVLQSEGETSKQINK